MSSETTLGIDLGTSRSKLTIADLSGDVKFQTSTPSPAIKDWHHGSLMPIAKWRQTVWSLLNTVRQHGPKASSVRAICITGITPVLVAFDIRNPKIAVGMPYWRLPEIDGLDSSPAEITARRAYYIRNKIGPPGSGSVVFTDLIGYINYQLTGKLTLNANAAADFGLNSSGAWPSEPAPDVYASQARCGSLTSSIARSHSFSSSTVVCCGAPDSLASAYSSGCSAPTEVMFYLGTFGSLMRLDLPISQLLQSEVLKARGYTWLLSVPGLGPKLQSLAARDSPYLPPQRRLRKFDQLASEAPAGAMGTIFLVPYWNSDGLTEGSFRFLEVPNNRKPTTQIRSRAALEGIGYIARTRLSALANPPTKIFLAGGGSESMQWAQILATVVQQPFSVLPLRAGAGGAASIAAAAMGSPLTPSDFCQVSPVETSAETIEANLSRCRSFYQ